MGLFFNQTLRNDLYRYEGNRCDSLKVRLKYVFAVPGFTYIFFMRHVAQARNGISRAFWAFFLHLTKYITHIQIPACTKIGRGFRIVHFGQIIISSDTRIGDNFNVFPGCLIGKTQGKRRGTPTIGNNVCMNANAVIIGKVNIGNDVLIAPGAFINFDVPDNSIVIGNPGRIIPRDSSPTEKYIVYPIRK